MYSAMYKIPRFLPSVYYLCAKSWYIATKSHVVVVDSHIQRNVLATEETTVTQQVSHRPIKCQSRLWSQGGKKVNGSHHGDNPLSSDQQGSKSRQKVMRLYKQWHRPMSKRFIMYSSMYNPSCKHKRIIQLTPYQKTHCPSLLYYATDEI